MPLLLAEGAVEWDLLLEAIWNAAVAGVAITLAMSLAILGATRWMEASRAGRPATQVAYGALFVLMMAVCAAGVALGILAMTQK